MVSLVPNPELSVPEVSTKQDRTKEFLATFPPPSILLMGEAGTGKTTSLYTLLEAGLEVNVLTTEPAGLQSLIDKILRSDPGLLRNLHWRSVAPAPASWDALKKLGTMVTQKGYEDISKEKDGIAKRQTAKYNEIILATENFVCERTGETIGDVTERGPNSCFAFDSLSGLSTIAYHHTVGYKPSPHQGEWGSMMSMIESYLLAVTSSRSSYFVLIAHEEMEVNELQGDVRKVMVSTLGKKLAPKIPKMFTEVVRAKRTGTEFSWSTADVTATLKTSILPISHNLKPSFQLCVEAYRKRMDAILGTSTTQA